MYQRVVLTGFMGAGKSTVGRLLADRLAWQFLDVDSILVERHGASIAELFAQHGEPYFRAIEADLIAMLLKTTDTVLALGGGAVEHPATQALLRQALSPQPAGHQGTCIVYLQTSLELSLARCHSQADADADAAVRPVLHDHSALAERFNRRLPLYQAAHLTLPTRDRLPVQLAEAIGSHLARQLPAAPALS